MDHSTTRTSTPLHGTTVGPDFVKSISAPHPARSIGIATHRTVPVDPRRSVADNSHAGVQAQLPIPRLQCTPPLIPGSSPVHAAGVPVLIPSSISSGNISCGGSTIATCTSSGITSGSGQGPGPRSYGSTPRDVQPTFTPTMTTTPVTARTSSSQRSSTPVSASSYTVELAGATSTVATCTSPSRSTGCGPRQFHKPSSPSVSGKGSQVSNSESQNGSQPTKKSARGRSAKNVTGPLSGYSPMMSSVLRGVMTKTSGVQLQCRQFLFVPDSQWPTNKVLGFIENVVGHRILVKFDLAPKHPGQWFVFQSRHLHSLSEVDMSTLEVPKGVQCADWKKYIQRISTITNTPPPELFPTTRMVAPDLGQLAPGVLVECVHPMAPDRFVLAKIVQTIPDTPYFQLEIPPIKELLGYSFFTDTLDGTVVHIGFALSHRIKLHHDPDLKGTPSKKEFFRRNHQHVIKDGDRVQAVNLLNPELIHSATVTKSYGSFVKVTFDDSRTFQYMDVLSECLLPEGWCESCGHPLSRYTKKLLSVSDSIAAGEKESPANIGLMSSDENLPAMVDHRKSAPSRSFSPKLASVSGSITSSSPSHPLSKSSHSKRGDTITSVVVSSKQAASPIPVGSPPRGIQPEAHNPSSQGACVVASSSPAAQVMAKQAVTISCMRLVEKHPPVNVGDPLLVSCSQSRTESSSCKSAPSGAAGSWGIAMPSPSVILSQQGATPQKNTSLNVVQQVIGTNSLYSIQSVSSPQDAAFRQPLLQTQAALVHSNNPQMIKLLTNYSIKGIDGQPICINASRVSTSSHARLTSSSQSVSQLVYVSSSASSIASPKSSPVATLKLPTGAGPLNMACSPVLLNQLRLAPAPGMHKGHALASSDLTRVILPASTVADPPQAVQSTTVSGGNSHSEKPCSEALHDEPEQKRLRLGLSNLPYLDSPCSSGSQVHKTPAAENRSFSPILSTVFPRESQSNLTLYGNEVVHPNSSLTCSPTHAETRPPADTSHIRNIDDVRLNGCCNSIGHTTSTREVGVQVSTTRMAERVGYPRPQRPQGSQDSSAFLRQMKDVIGNELDMRKWNTDEVALFISYLCGRDCSDKVRTEELDGFTLLHLQPPALRELFAMDWGTTFILSSCINEFRNHLLARPPHSSWSGGSSSSSCCGSIPDGHS